MTYRMDRLSIDCSDESLSMCCMTYKTPRAHACCFYEISKQICGPLLDRIDVHIEVPSVDWEKLSRDKVRASSEVVRDIQ